MKENEDREVFPGRLRHDHIQVEAFCIGVRELLVW